MEQAQQVAKPAADVTSIGIAGGALLGYLPPIAAGLSIVWMGLQIYSWVINERYKKEED